MTPRVQALTDYFYLVFKTDPKMRAAGWDPRKLGSAVLSCVAEDMPAMIVYVCKNGAAAAEPKIRETTRQVGSTVLGGVVSERVAEHALSAVDELIGEGFKWVGKVIDKRVGKQK